MSKSKNNGIDPQVMIDKYGADTVRLFMMFAAPPEATLEWSDSGVEGAQRFLRRVYRLVADFVAVAEQPQSTDWSKLNDAQQDLRRQVHRTIEKVTDDFGRRQHFNTGIAAIMELLNSLQKATLDTPEDRAIMAEAVNAIVVMLTPVTPHLSEHLWQQLGHQSDLNFVAWPSFDADALVETKVLVVVQVNGKVRAKITVPAEATEEHVRAIAHNDENVLKFLTDKTIRKEIYIAGKLFNIVAN